MTARQLVWLGRSREAIRNFPAEVRYQVGQQLWRIQTGRDPTDWKPMPSIGTGVRELRIHGRSEYRVVYVARFGDGVYVLHAFEKKTRKTPGLVVELVRLRYRRHVEDLARRGG